MDPEEEGNPEPTPKFSFNEETTPRFDSPDDGGNGDSQGPAPTDDDPEPYPEENPGEHDSQA